MKTLCYILGVMILVLSLVPCTDVHTAISKDRVEISSATDNSNHMDGDICSPFCQCTCCTSPTLLYLTTITIDHLSDSLNQPYGEHVPGKPMETLFSVWQPPRLS